MTLKRRVAAGEPLLGTFLKTPHPHVVEVLSTSGLDLLCIDAEHAPFDRGSIDTCVMAARAGGMPLLVRTPTAAAHEILNALDCGADGVLVPHVRTAAEAEAIARAAHYGHGGRGYAGSSRAAGYGSLAMADHKASSRERTTVIVQIEDVDAIASSGAIAAVSNVDAVFIGRIDLTVALGCESPDDQPVIEAVETIVAACRAVGTPVGMFLARPADAPGWVEKGVSLFLLGSDHMFLRQGAATLRDAAGLVRRG